MSSCEWKMLVRQKTQIKKTQYSCRARWQKTVLWETQEPKHYLSTKKYSRLLIYQFPSFANTVSAPIFSVIFKSQFFKLFCFQLQQIIEINILSSMRLIPLWELKKSCLHVHYIWWTGNLLNDVFLKFIPIYKANKLDRKIKS